MTASLSSRVQLLLNSAPFSNVDPQILAEREEAVAAWQLDVGQELASESIPIAHVVLVVEVLRKRARCHRNPFTIRRVQEWWPGVP